ncbi:WLM-domain-containing protein [Lentithecium fluviatile CBS 122367]|uniref:WLM-domain-containing protein n=1 Tax=Lentithecium fluviatile CBS 122367 TaxID=1168545 RepID=A0A6G1ID54_9PLEO|nr:WLM-domain-containing protein [Lentithecium fluviatile CBS 122367]
MPLGWERINERAQRPNALINFIKPLPGPTATTAENILNRVAAICYPFMKSHMILVQALEEFPCNTEFVGRNFNAGEVIQLVLKDRSGRWLPQRMIEMVMVHELAHCKQMNHSKAFWKARDAYAVELRGLWGKGYTGEGMWGKGRNLVTGDVQRNDVDPGDIPEHLCGGTYGRRAKKRRRGGKEKETLSYAERKQRRIVKKFGAGGQALGADDDAKVKLEGGVAKKGKPRVAGSARGRDLRAAAALARYEPVKKEQVEIKEETPSDSETEDEYEVGHGDAAIDVDGKRMTDDKGRALVKICEEENDQDGNARREMDEIQDLERPKLGPQSKKPPQAAVPLTSQRSNVSSEPSPYVVHLDEIYKRRPDPPPKPSVEPASITATCVVCSLANEPGSLTCAVCSNVLNPHLVANHWQCGSATCKDSQYVNSGDVGRCGACGAAKAVV